MKWKLRWLDLKGRALLQKYLERATDREQTPGDRRSAIAQATRELAATLGTSAVTVYSWRIGFRRPGPDYYEPLKRIAGIAPDAWRTREEKARARRLRAA